MEEKKSNWLLVVVALLCLLIGLAGGYFISTNFSKETKTKGTDTSKDKDADVNIEKDYNIEEAKTLVYKYYKDGIINNLNNDSDVWDQTYDMEKDLLSILYLHISEKDWKSISCKKVAKKGEGIYEGYYVIDDYNCTGKSISYEFMNKLYKELFGSSKELPKKSGEIHIIREEGVGSVPAYFAYNKENDMFILGEIFGDENGPYENHYYSIVKSSKIKENKLVISLAYIALLDYDSVSDPIYQIGQEKIKPEDSKIKGLTPEQIMTKYLNQLDTFEFTFVKDGDHYVLESVK